MSVHKKLMDARLILQSRKLDKSGYNKFAGYNYFELGDFIIPAQEIFAELGLCGVVSFTPDIAKLTITDIDGGGVIEITSPMGSAALKGCHEVQNIGAVETYQRRYLWVAALEIVEHDALDATTGKAEPAQKVQLPKAGPEAHSPAKLAFEMLDAETQDYLRSVAVDVHSLCHKGDIKGAVERIELEQLDADSKAGLWSLLDSKERSAIKAAAKVPA